MLTYAHKRKLSKNNPKIDWNFDTNESIMKIYKSHRDANGFDGKFICEIMSELIGCKTENVSKNTAKRLTS